MRTTKPRAPAPSLEFDTLDNGGWKLSDRQPDAFTMIVLYRGLHCPVCAGYLRELASKSREFETRGVHVVAVSGDDEARAQQAPRLGARLLRGRPQPANGDHAGVGPVHLKPGSRTASQLSSASRGWF